ncbi:MAG TPA: VOC family protein [Thermoanaerobaculia bacterium]|nr:VOC family protein [Thermoanaerobaculia bacterium]
MLKDEDAIATVAVTNIEVARKFYEGVLGLAQRPTGEKGVLSFSSGKSSLLVYESQYAGTNEATAVTWTVEDVDAEVKALKSKGVSFEHYDFPGVTRKGDVHVTGKLKNAWFKDPDGNILSVVGQ